MTTLRRIVVIALAAAAAVVTAPTSPARASVLSPVCPVLKHVPLAPGCSEASHTLTAGRALAAGNVGGAVSGVLGGALGGVASLGLDAIAGWAADSARYALHETAVLIDATSTPRLAAPWFAHVYWRLAGISVLLTLPCLFAAAVQALIRSDLSLLVRAAFGYLPGAMLAVGICAQLTSLLLAAVDGLCSLVSGAAGQAASGFLNHAGRAIVALSAVSRSPFLAFVIAAFTVAGAIALWLELMMRAAAVYVVVAMLPLAFAGFVWPARRVWALRAIELLAALILAKLAMVTVLTLGGAALESAPNAAGFLAGLVLLVLGVFSPWAMLRMVPLAELAGGAAGRLRGEMGLPGMPELLPTAAGGAGQTLGGAAAARLIRGPGAARAAAESVVAHMHGNAGEPPIPPANVPGPAEDGGAAADAPPGPSGAEPPDLAQQEPATPTSMFTAPDYSWRNLELSGEARWREGPLWPGDMQAARGGPDPGTAGEPRTPAPDDDPPPSVTPPELPSDTPFPDDSPDLRPGDPQA